MNRYSLKCIIKRNLLFAIIYIVSCNIYIVKTYGVEGFIDLDILPYLKRHDFWIITIAFFIFCNWLSRSILERDIIKSDRYF